MKIYLAHNLAARDYLLKEVVPKLRSWGYFITSSWILDDSHYDGSRSGLDSAQEGLEDINRADELLLFTDQFAEKPGKGKFFELGYAYALRKKCYILGEDRSCVFYNLPFIIKLDALLDITKHASHPLG